MADGDSVDHPCFLTKTKFINKAAVQTTTVPSATVTVRKTKKATVTKIIAGATVTKIKTTTVKRTSTHYLTTTSVVKVTYTSSYHSTTTKPITRTVTTYVPEPTTSTSRPITTVTLPATGASEYLTTVVPTDSSSPITVIEYVTRPIVTTTEFDTSTYATTVFPSDITDIFATITVITFAPRQTVTITRAGPSSFATTASPTGPRAREGTVTVIDFVPIKTTTVTSIGSSAFTTTLLPTDSLDPSATATVIYYVTRATVTTSQLGTSLSTSTVFPTDTTDPNATVTIIDYVPPPFTQTITVGGTTDYTTTVIPTNNDGSAISTATATVIQYIKPTAGPPLPCSRNSYFVVPGTLASINLMTGDTTNITTDFNSGTSVLSLGYNVLDGYLYALQAGGMLLQIDATGATASASSITYPTSSGGDIDTNGQFWIISFGRNWNQIDLNPASPKFGATMSQGISPPPSSYSVTDWVYIPSTDSLWASVTSFSGPPGLARWSKTTLLWELVTTWPNLPITNSVLMFADSNGDFYFNDSDRGLLYRINVFNLAAPVLVGSTYVTLGSADGARCVYGNTVS
ncbi:hypothetical protein ABW20_dc0104531 [Dactylellina cionopaga]|nr:hypothetical protein ABW20_dc0104531 [Dactylellina cionopaga]